MSGCTPCRGTGIYPLDIDAVESGRLRPENARGCGACYGTIRRAPAPALVTRVRAEPATATRIEAPDGDLLALAIQRAGGRNPFIESAV